MQGPEGGGRLYEGAGEGAPHPHAREATRSLAFGSGGGVPANLHPHARTRAPQHGPMGASSGPMHGRVCWRAHHQAACMRGTMHDACMHGCNVPGWRIMGKRCHAAACGGMHALALGPATTTAWPMLLPQVRELPALCCHRRGGVPVASNVPGSVSPRTARGHLHVPHAHPPAHLLQRAHLPGHLVRWRQWWGMLHACEAHSVCTTHTHCRNVVVLVPDHHAGAI